MGLGRFRISGWAYGIWLPSSPPSPLPQGWGYRVLGGCCRCAMQGLLEVQLEGGNSWVPNFRALTACWGVWLGGESAESSVFHFCLVFCLSVFFLFSLHFTFLVLLLLCLLYFLFLLFFFFFTSVYFSFSSSFFLSPPRPRLPLSLNLSLSLSLPLSLLLSLPLLYPFSHFILLDSLTNSQKCCFSFTSLAINNVKIATE